MQAALVGLMASGYRPDTKVSGHHQTVIQSLPKTVGLPAQRLAVLDALRTKRNLSDYTGKLAPDERGVPGRRWAQGFMRGVELRRHGWTGRRISR